MLKEIWRGFCDLLYPPHCLLCKTYLGTFSPVAVLCPRCEDFITQNYPPFCPKCSRHLKIAQPRCPACRHDGLHFDFAWAACLYHAPLSDLICQFKYNQRTYLRRFFARLMTTFIETYKLDIRQFDLIAPIPLFSSRRRERGFNQSELLGKLIGEAYQIPLSLNNLVRARSTEHQTLLSEKERWTNIQGAFRILRPEGFSDKNVLIIDDLLTTGATASEAALAVKNAGAKTVGVLTLAITC